MVVEDQFIVEVTKDRFIQSTRAKEAATLRKSCAPGDAPGHARLMKLQTSLLIVGKDIGSLEWGRIKRGPFFIRSVDTKYCCRFKMGQSLDLLPSCRNKGLIVT